MAQWLTNPTRNHEVAGSIPGLAHWVWLASSILLEIHSLLKNIFTWSSRRGSVVNESN